MKCKFQPFGSARVAHIVLNLFENRQKFYCLYFLMIYFGLVLNESYLNVHMFGLPKVEIFYLYLKGK